AERGAVKGEARRVAVLHALLAVTAAAVLVSVSVLVSCHVVRSTPADSPSPLPEASVATESAHVCDAGVTEASELRAPCGSCSSRRCTRGRTRPTSAWSGRRSRRRPLGL